MKRLALKKFLLPLSLPLIASFSACSSDHEVAGGPGSITTNGIVASAGGVPVPYARVSLRHADFVVSDANEELSIVGDADALADSVGRFALELPDSGEFRLTVVHDGIAFSKIIDRDGYTELDSIGSVSLEATATVTGVADIPSGNKSIWVGVLGTDVLVRSDSNGVFVIPEMPANDSMQLYFMDESYGEELQRKSVFLSPYEQVLLNYKTVAVDSATADSAEIPVDTVPKVTVLFSDDSPAAYATVAMRQVDAATDKYFVRNSMVVADLHADENGQFVMEAPESGKYRLTVTSGGQSFSRIYDVEDLPKTDTLVLAPSVKFSSNVTLKSGEDFSWVGVLGLDELVKTDVYGSYVLPALPANDSLIIYFVHKDSSVVFMDLNVATESRSASWKPSVMLNDFEGESDGWYLSVDTLGKGSTFYGTDGKPEKNPQIADRVYIAGRESKSFNGYYGVAYDPYAWVLLGTQFSENLNMSGLDSIEFYARGNGNIRVALENWENYTQSQKAASRWIGLDSVWTRIVVTPSELCWDSKEVKDCEKTWDDVKTNVKQIHLFPAGGNEFHVDDIKLYGVLFK